MRVYLINQTGRPLLPCDGRTKYSCIAQRFVKDRDIEVVNQTALAKTPFALPYFPRQTELNGLASHFVDNYDPIKAASYREIHFQHFLGLVNEALQARAIPVLLANPHELSMGMYRAIQSALGTFDILCIIADRHLDSYADTFASGGFLRNALRTGYLRPGHTIHIGSDRLSVSAANGKFVILDIPEIISKLPADVLEIIKTVDAQAVMRGMDGGWPKDVSYTMTELVKAIYGYEGEELQIEVKDYNKYLRLLAIVCRVWERVYLNVVGVFIDQDRYLPSGRGWFSFFSFDTNVSSAGNRIVGKVQGTIENGLRDATIVGVHIAKAETPSNIWGADYIFEFTKDVLQMGNNMFLTVTA